MSNDTKAIAGVVAYYAGFLAGATVVSLAVNVTLNAIFDK